jgi:predicted Zn-dependent protease
MKWPHALWLLCFSLPAFCETDIPQQAGAPQISFNDLQYRLGYDVYLANKNLAAAWQVAYKAISAEPNNVFWLQRFAQVSEWVGKPVEALEAWFKYAQATNDNSAWDNVGRLAEALYNDTLLLAYQKRLVSLHPNDEAAILKLVQVYERLGQPNEGLDFLAQLVSKSKAKRTLLTAEANLAERAGQDERAIATFSRLINSFPPVETTWLLRRAALWFQRGKVLEAWHSLNEIENKIAPRNADYWHTYAELSRLLNKKEAAERAYQHLTDEFVFGDGDLTNYSALQNDTDPLNAAFVSELSYRLYKRDNAVISLLYLYQKANHPQGTKRFLALLSAQELEKFEQNRCF